MSKKYSIAIADDEPLFREGISMLINRHQVLDCQIKASNGQELIDVISAGNSRIPDLVLCDLEMPILDGVETTKQLHQLYPDLKIVILSMHYESGIIMKMMELGASSYLPKNEKPAEFYETIINTIEKGFHYNDYIVKLIRDKVVGKVQLKENMISLTSREKEILQGICEQKTNKEIGSNLFISTRTVEGHRNKLLDKTNSRNTAGLIIYAIENGLYDVDIKNHKWGQII